MFLVSALEKKLEMNGIGINVRRGVGLARAWNGFAGGVRRVVLEKA